MISLDTTFLIDLYWLDSPRHQKAVDCYKILSNLNEEIIIYYNCFNEFIHVITDTKRFSNALSMDGALEITETWCNLENITVVYPFETSFAMAKAWLSIYKLGRNRLNDTNMAACYAQSGASRIVTANPKDFEIFQVLEPVDYTQSMNFKEKS